MIFIFADDRSVQIVNSLEEVKLNCEGIDVENRVFSFFDENGSTLEPRFPKPNRKVAISESSHGWNRGNTS